MEFIDAACLAFVTADSAKVDQAAWQAAVPVDE
jgi:hypothetical protein